jgi:1,4-dihydroxy-2-naphthoyl-CoA hydrolase
MNGTARDQLWQMLHDPAKRTLLGHLGIEVTYLEKDGMQASMPVDYRTIQPFGLLHGGASVALAESLASCAAALHIDTDKQIAVGLEINANHLRSVTGGHVHGEAKPVHIGRNTQVWSIEIKNDEGKLVCISRCTMAVVDKKP